MWSILTTLHILLKKADLYKRITLVSLIIVFFLGNYHICNYFYPLNDPDSIELWWMLKVDIYAFIVALCFILAAQRPNNNVRLRLIERFIMDVGIGLAISNVIDRRLHGIRGYRIMDIAMVMVVFLASYYNFKRLSKIAKKKANETG